MPEFVNWAGNQQSTPFEVAEPSSERDVRELVLRASEAGRRIKAVGSGHSWSDIALTDGVLVSLRRMDRLVRIGDGAVTVEGGMSLTKLVRLLDCCESALPILGSISDQSVAGAIATGTHGSSLRWGNLSSLVTGVRLVTATGEVLDLGGDDPRLDAARGHLGALGIVTQVSLRIEPQFWLVEQTSPMEFAAAAGSLAEIAASAEYVKVWWFPHTDRVTVFRYERTEDRRDHPASRRQVEKALNRWVFPALLDVGRRRPALVPGITRRVGAVYARPQTRGGRSHQMFTLPMPPLNREIEYSIAMDAGEIALRGLRALIEEHGFPVNFPAEVRFVKADTGWMSPAHGRDSVQLGAYMAAGERIDEYFAAFEQMMLDLGGRPHPGKEHGFVAADLISRFEHGERFRRLAFDLDPNGVFANEFVDRWLGPRGHR